MACAALAWAWHLRGLLHRERQQAVDRVATSVGLAAEQAAAQERERIYADLHDDMGARLLTLVHTAENPRQADIARSLLQEMRRVVTRSRGTPGTLTDVLADIRSDESLESIPVIVLTTSGAPEDVAQSYKLKANCYVQKPVDLTEFMSAIKALDNFWFIHATLPPPR